jgi:hypothetical protein
MPPLIRFTPPLFIRRFRYFADSFRYFLHAIDAAADAFYFRHFISFHFSDADIFDTRLLILIATDFPPCRFLPPLRCRCLRRFSPRRALSLPPPPRRFARYSHSLSPRRCHSIIIARIRFQDFHAPMPLRYFRHIISLRCHFHAISWLSPPLPPPFRYADAASPPCRCQRFIADIFAIDAAAS